MWLDMIFGQETAQENRALKAWSECIDLCTKLGFECINGGWHRQVLRKLPGHKSEDPVGDRDSRCAFGSQCLKPKSTTQALE